MLDQFFFNPKSLPLLGEGPLARHLEGFCRWLNDQGYARMTIRRYVVQASHFSRYLQQRLVALPDLKRGDVRAFLSEHLPVCQCELVGLRQDKAYSSLQRLLEYLLAQGLKIDPKPPPPPPFHAPLQEGYLEFLRCCRQLAPSTIRYQRYYLGRFLTWLGGDATPERLGRLTVSKVHDFCLFYGRQRGRSQRRWMQSTLRSFFRFCLKEGYLRRDLSPAVPSLRTYKLARLPSVIGEEEIRRVLCGIDRSTGEGRRDYAIFQILFTYGVRGAQVRSLLLNDIHWEQSRIHFSAMKGSRSVDLPLTEEVGNSLLDYLQNGRPAPASPRPHVFLAPIAPHGPLRKSFSRIISGRMRAAGVDAQVGAHAFRHAFASRMLRRGQPLKAIADMLGHRALQSTFIYTKIDFQTLQQVALPWPEVSS